MRVTVLLLLTLLLLSSGVLSTQRRKFRHWLPYYKYHWEDVLPMCKTQLEDYYTNNRSTCTTPCACVVDCFLNNTTQSMQSNLNSANIILGLGPPILAFVGPSRGEMAVLSTHRPFFTSLISFGFPSMSIGGLFVPVDVSDILKRPVPKLAQAYHSWLETQTLGVRLTILTMLWIAAAGALVNNVYTSIYLDLRTVSGWRCGADYMPLGWSLTGIVIAAPEMLAIRTRTHPVPQRDAVSPRTRKEILDYLVAKPDISPYILPGSEDRYITEILFWVASLFSILQTVLGTVVLSAILFASFLDALPILARYGASSIVGSFLLRLELSGLKCELRKRERVEAAVSQTASISFRRTI